MARNQSEQTHTVLPRPAAELLATRLNAVFPHWHRWVAGALMLNSGLRVGPKVLCCDQPKIDLRDAMTVEGLMIVVRIAWPNCRIEVQEHEDTEMYLNVYSPAHQRFVFRGDVDSRPVAYIKAIEAGVEYQLKHLQSLVPRGA